MAEGFIKEESHKRLEKLGEEYLHDLINRSLIMISGRSSDGTIKTCRMHDLLHDLCARKAKKEKLLNKYRSILCFNKYDLMDFTFKMLRVLDLTAIDYEGRIPHDIMDVVLLRYLALASSRLLNSIPLWKNRNLQTLIVCEDINGAQELPHGIWDLPQLRHLEFYHQLSIYTPGVVQVNLQTMYWLHSFQCTKQVLLRIPNVNELGIIAHGCRCHCHLDNLSCLNQLETLKVQGTYRPIKLPTHADAFPQNLKKITFAKTLLPWEAMSIISMLPNLEVLKLKNHACRGQEWELTEEGGFGKLKLLLISVTDLKHWNADAVDNPFPALERLVLRNCFELKRMPSWIVNINYTLKSIQLEFCYASLVSSARKIEEEQYENYGVKFEILEFHTRSEEQKHEKAWWSIWIPCLPCAWVEDPRYWIKARSLSIAWVKESRYWNWTCESGRKVVELLRVCWFDIRGTVDTKCLLRMTCYSAYLVFKLKRWAYGLDTALASVRYLKDKRSYSENQRCQVFVAKGRSSRDCGRFPHCRRDGWMELKLGDFYVSSGNEGEVQIRLWNTENMNWKSGLIVRGIEIRPNQGENEVELCNFM